MDRINELNAVGAEPSALKIKEKLWVITELYYPEDNQTGYYLTRIAEGLAADFEVKVICGQPNYAARGIKAPKRETHRGVEIFRVWGTTLDKDIMSRRLLNMLTLGGSMFFQTLLKISRNERILVVSAPPSLPFGTALAAKLRGAQYNLIIQDKYPEILTAVGKTKSDSRFVRVLDFLNTKLYDAAEKIIVVGRDMKELVGRQLTKSDNPNDVESKISVIQNWAALEEIEPLPRDENELLKELGLTDKFVFLYAGNMGHPQDLESIVECAFRLRDDVRFHFLFIGSGVKKKWLERAVVEKKLLNVTVIAPRPRNEQKIFLNACDVGLVPLVNRMFGVAMPSRTYNFLAAGKPILALTENASEIARVIEEDQVGWFVPPHSPDLLEQMVRRIFSEKHRLPEISRRARQSAVEKYSAEVAVQKFRKIMHADKI